MKKGSREDEGELGSALREKTACNAPDEDIEIEKRATIEAEKDTRIWNPLGG